MKTEILDLDVRLIPFTINKEFSRNDKGKKYMARVTKRCWS